VLLRAALDLGLGYGNPFASAHHGRSVINGFTPPLR